MQAQVGFRNLRASGDARYRFRRARGIKWSAALLKRKDFVRARGPFGPFAGNGEPIVPELRC